MQNVLMFPTKKLLTKETIFEKLKSFLEKKRAEKRARFEKKVIFLRQQTYFFYLKKFLNARKKQHLKIVDFPDFVYLSGAAISTDALRLTNIVIDKAIKKGHRHVEKCFKKCVKQISK